MSLLLKAQKDAQAFTTNTALFAHAVTISYQGVDYSINAMSTNIGKHFDADTGAVISGQSASCTISTLELNDKSIPHPKAELNEAKPPYLITFSNLGKTYTFKVVDVFPDRTLGLHVCILEKFKNVA